MKKIVSLLLVAMMALGAVSALAYEYNPLKGDLGGVMAAEIEKAINKYGEPTGYPLPAQLKWQVGSVDGKGSAKAFDYETFMALWIFARCGDPGSSNAPFDSLADVLVYLGTLTNPDYETAFANRHTATAILGCTVL